MVEPLIAQRDLMNETNFHAVMVKVWVVLGGVGLTLMVVGPAALHIVNGS